MTLTTLTLTELLADCEAHGIRLAPTAQGGLEIDAPQEALTPERLARLKAHKADLLALLWPTPETAPTLPGPTNAAPASPAKAVCRCGGTTWQDVPIHDGQSVRRDCGRCGRFLSFPVWYGQERYFTQ